MSIFRNVFGAFNAANPVTTATNLVAGGGPHSGSTASVIAQLLGRNQPLQGTLQQLGQVYGQGPPTPPTVPTDPGPPLMPPATNTPGRAMEMASTGDPNGYSMGGGGVERAYSRLQDDLPVDSGGITFNQDPNLNLTPVMDPTKPGAPVGTDQTAPMTQPGPGGWQMPGMAFAPGASQNAPRLFQDPTTGQWTLSEHGNFRGNLSPEDVTSAQGYVTDFWNQFPTGFIQPGQTNFDPNQALSNEQYGQPSNWQNLYTNAGLTPPTQSATPTPLIGQAQPAWPQPDPTAMPPNTGGTLSELSNPERVNQLSQSSYGGGDMDRLREALKGLA